METNTFKKLKNKKQDNYPEYLIVHHSMASENQTVQSIENYHLDLGWEGVGYQYLINFLGEIWKGRPEYYHGAHCKEQGMNTKSIGICLIGNFDKKLPTEAQIISLKALMKDIQARYNIPNNKIVPHRHFAPYKTCYGSRLADDWAGDLIELSIKKKEMVCVPKALIQELARYIKT